MPSKSPLKPGAGPNTSEHIFSQQATQTPQVAMPLIAGVIAVPVGPAAAIWCGSGLLIALAAHQYHRNHR